MDGDKMPKKPKQPCSYPGCPKLSDGRYCEEHRKIVEREYEHYGRKYKKSERYGNVWSKVRDRYIKAHPLCEICFENGVISPTEIVHHIRPLDEGGTHDANNLMSVCRQCHAKIHGKRGDYRDGGGKVYHYNKH